MTDSSMTESAAKLPTIEQCLKAREWMFFAADHALLSNHVDWEYHCEKCVEEFQNAASALGLHVSPQPAAQQDKRPTIAELEALLASESDEEIEILPDGSIRPKQPAAQQPSDLVRRLRSKQETADFENGRWSSFPIRSEAADRIEALEAAQPKVLSEDVVRLVGVLAEVKYRLGVVAEGCLRPWGDRHHSSLELSLSDIRHSMQECIPFIADHLAQTKPPHEHSSPGTPLEAAAAQQPTGFEPRFSTAWEREDYERRKRGEPELGPFPPAAQQSQTSLVERLRAHREGHNPSRQTSHEAADRIEALEADKLILGEEIIALRNDADKVALEAAARCPSCGWPDRQAAIPQPHGSNQDGGEQRG